MYIKHKTKSKNQTARFMYIKHETKSNGGVFDLLLGNELWEIYFIRRERTRCIEDYLKLSAKVGSRSASCGSLSLHTGINM